MSNNGESAQIPQIFLGTKFGFRAGCAQSRVEIVRDFGYF